MPRLPNGKIPITLFDSSCGKEPGKLLELVAGATLGLNWESHVQLVLHLFPTCIILGLESLKRCHVLLKM